MTEIISQANALSLILNHARSTGLPLPRTFRFDEDCHQLVLSMRTPQDVIEWARWMEIEHDVYPSGRETYYFAEGTALDASIRVSAFQLDDAEPREVEAVGLTIPHEPVSDGVTLIGGGA